MNSGYIEEYDVIIERRHSDGKLLSEQWRNQDDRITDPPHCPAERQWNPDTGVVVSEARYRNGALHTEDGHPSAIARHPLTGATLWEEWHRHGRLRPHTEGPSYVEYDPETGNKIGEEYRDENRRLHRDSAPAIVRFDPATGAVTRERFFDHGKETTPYSPWMDGLEP